MGFSLTGMMIKLMTWIVVFAGPLFTLAYIQYKFLPYHHYFNLFTTLGDESGKAQWLYDNHIGITTVHQLLVIINALILFLYWLKIRNPGWKWRQLFTLKHLGEN